MTDSHRKRKFAGMRPQEKRQIDQDPMRLPPHKKPRTYRLEVSWTETQTMRYTQDFTSKDARDQAKLSIKRKLAEKKYLSWVGWADARNFRVKEGPFFKETMLVAGKPEQMELPYGTESNPTER